MAKKKVIPISAQCSSVFASTFVRFFLNSIAIITNAMVNLIAMVRNGPMVRIAIVENKRELALSASASPTRNSPLRSFIWIFMSHSPLKGYTRKPSGPVS